MRGRGLAPGAACRARGCRGSAASSPPSIAPRPSRPRGARPHRPRRTRQGRSRPRSGPSEIRRAARRGAGQAHDLVAARGEARAERRADQPACSCDEDLHRGHLLDTIRSAPRCRSHGPTSVDEIIGGDLTAALAYVTPAGGAVVTAVAPIGLRDRAAGTVTFTTSLGLGAQAGADRAQPPRGARLPRARARLCRRLRVRARPGRRAAGDRAGPQLPRGHGEAPGDALHGTAEGGKAVLGPVAARVLPGPHPGGGGRRAPDRLGGRPVRRPARTRSGTAAAGEPPAQDEPAKGAGPRVDSERAAARLRSLDHLLLAYVGADGYPEVVPVRSRTPARRASASRPSARSRPGVAGRACSRTRTGRS